MTVDRHERMAAYRKAATLHMHVADLLNRAAGFAEADNATVEADYIAQARRALMAALDAHGEAEHELAPTSS